MNNQIQIAICVGCVCAKIKNHHKFPIICPKINLPCLAIRPDIMDNSEKREKMVRNNLNGIECNDYNFLDKEYINAMKKAERKLLREHIIVPYNEADK